MQSLRIGDFTGGDSTRLAMWADYATTDEEANTDAAWLFPIKTWLWIVGTYDDALAAGSKMKLYVGTQYAEMLDLTVNRSAAVGGRVGPATRSRIGNAATASATWDGYLESVIIHENSTWSFAEAKAYRQGWRPTNATDWLPLTETYTTATTTPLNYGTGTNVYAATSIELGQARAPQPVSPLRVFFLRRVATGTAVTAATVSAVASVPTPTVLALGAFTLRKHNLRPAPFTPAGLWPPQTRNKLMGGG